MSAPIASLLPRIPMHRHGDPVAAFTSTLNDPVSADGEMFARLRPINDFLKDRA